MPKRIDDPTLPQGFSITFRSRFWANVNKNGPIPQHTPHLGQCWVWTGACSGGRYGTIGTHRQQLSAHRASWIIHFGPIPDGLWVLHKCDFGKCVRDSHLFLGTEVDNYNDMIAKGRRAPLEHGEDRWNARLTEEKVIEIRAIEGLLQKEIAELYGVSRATVGLVRQRRIWKHVI